MAKASVALKKTAPSGIATSMKSILTGQDSTVDLIAPYVETFTAGLSPEGKPAGVFLLLGPTGTGKTFFVEALAKVLHGSNKHVLKISCEEFQHSHELAKILGAPPGYLGHRETISLLTQSKLNAVTSEQCGLSLVLFDEIEKAHTMFSQALLGITDKASLTLGDNTKVNFERSLVFFTSNLGAAQLASAAATNPYGYTTGDTPAQLSVATIERICLAAAKRRFSPEFMNRLDEICAFAPLTAKDYEFILDAQLHSYVSHVLSKLGIIRGFTIRLDPAARRFILSEGTSPEYGARELKRVLQRQVFQPLAKMYTNGEIPAGAELVICGVPDGLKFEIL